MSDPELTPLNVAAVGLLAGSYYVPKDLMAPGPRRVIVQVAGCAASFAVFMLGVRRRDPKVGSEQQSGSAVKEASVSPSEDQLAPEGEESTKGQPHTENQSPSEDQLFREKVLKKLEADGAMGDVESSGNGGWKSNLLGVGLLGGVCALIGASIWATLRLDKWAVGKLRKRGVKYPNSAWGAVNFAAAVASLALDD